MNKIKCNHCGDELTDLREIEYEGVSIVIENNKVKLKAMTVCSNCDSDINITFPVDELNDGNFVIYQYRCNVDWDSAIVGGWNQ